MNDKATLSSARTPDEVRAEIERARRQIESSVVELREEMAMRTDWRAWVRRRPGWFVLGAFAVGVALGSRRSSTR